MSLNSFTLKDIPIKNKVLVATTTGVTAQNILRNYNFNAYVFHQNRVIKDKYFCLSKKNKQYILSHTKHLYEIPLNYCKSILSKAYLKSLLNLSNGAKVCFEMMVYALERGYIMPGEVVYAVAGENSGWDTIVRFEVPVLNQFHQGGYSEFTIWVDSKQRNVNWLIKILSQKNEYLPTIIYFYPKVLKEENIAWIPYSLLAIASVVDQDKYYSYIIDNNLNHYETYYDELSAISYKVIMVGISCMIGYQIIDMLNFVSEVKSINQDLPIVVGGGLPTIQPDIVLRHKSIDYIIMSQGEQTFLELLKSKGDKHKLKDILGLGFKTESKNWINDLRPIINRQKLPNYPFELIDIGKYVKSVKALGKKALNYISSQGCPNKCAFCSDNAIYQGRWTAKPIDKVIKEIKYLVEVYSLDSIKMHDSNFMVSENRVNSFCDALINMNLKIYWGASIHPKILSNLNEKTLIKMKKTGCKRLLIGAESGNQKELDLIRKGITVDTIYKNASILKKHNIVGTFTIMIGLPFTTQEFILNSIQLAKNINKIWDQHMTEILIYLPYPGTDLYKLIQNDNFVEPDDLEAWGNYEYIKKTNNEKDYSVYLKAIDDIKKKSIKSVDC
ncbi:MAG: B12-binding domain-containing radical SAM protein [bacterium]